MSAKTRMKSRAMGRLKDFGFKLKQAIPRTLATFPDHNLVEL